MSLTISTKLTTLEVAKWLIGKELVTKVGGVETAGLIVETEAYGPVDDPASHAHTGERVRNSVMFRAAGHVYVYRIYGAHYCVNFVTENDGAGSAVLIRALEPTRGLETMQKRRKTDVLRDIARGPGRLCQALGITINQNGEVLGRSDILTLHHGREHSDDEIRYSHRIGITKATELPWRVALRDSRFVSGSLSANS